MPSSITTVTTATLSTLHRMNCKIVTGLQPLLCCENLLRPNLYQLCRLMPREFLERRAVLRESSGGKQSFVSGYEPAPHGYRRGRRRARLGLHVVAAQKIYSVHSVAGNQTRNFIQHRQRIEGTQLWFQIV